MERDWWGELMANPWFRLYSEFAFDPKIQSMSETLQRRYIMLLCLKCNDDLEKLNEEELAVALRIDEETLQETKAIFLRKGLIDEDWEILKWDKRQFLSDKSDPTAAERQKRYRENKRNDRNATVTSHSPESDTDTELKEYTLVLEKEKLEEEFEKVWERYPNKDGKKAALRHFIASVKTDKDVVRIHTALDKYLEHIEREGKQNFLKNGSTWFNNWQDWENYKPPQGVPLKGNAVVDAARSVLAKRVQEGRYEEGA